MKKVYHIRDGKGNTVESSHPEVARLIDEGKLMYTGRKARWNKQTAELNMFQYYLRGNFEKKEPVVCPNRCCDHHRR